MKKIALVVAVLLLALVPAGLFAANPFDYEATKPGDTNLNAGVSAGFSHGFGFGADLGADFIIGKFDIKEFPIEWGIGVRGLADLYFGGGGAGFEWGVAGLWTVHKGFSFGDKANFDFYLSVGPGIGGYTGGWGFGLGVATCEGIAWQLTDQLWLQLEYCGIYGWQVSTSITSIGVRFAL
jgi:hypothetical protein